MSGQMSSAAMSKELADIALAMQSERTGHTPKAVTVVASDETVVVTLQEALTPAEKILVRTEAGASKVEDYHRALFEAAVVMEPASGALVHAFTSGTMVQIFQLEPLLSAV